MNILYTCDNNYIWIMGISLISLLENSKNQKELDIYLLGDHISEENKQIVYSITARYNRKCVIIDVPKLSIPDILISQRWPVSAFSRLFAGQLLPQNVEEILYLDCDTIIVEDISNLSNVNMDDNIFYGVKDCVGKAYKKNIGLDKNDVYINAGVLLINVKKMREIDVACLMEKYLYKYKMFINYADQDILNGVFRNKIGFIKSEYNVMTLLAVYSYEAICSLRSPTNFYTKEEIRFAVKNPKIIHYTTCMLTIRPWFFNSNHPFAKEFVNYKKISPWNDIVLKEFQFSNNEAKVIRIVQKLPIGLSNIILGFMHSKLKPFYIGIIAKVRQYL